MNNNVTYNKEVNRGAVESTLKCLKSTRANKTTIYKPYSTAKPILSKFHIVYINHHRLNRVVILESSNNPHLHQ